MKKYVLVSHIEKSSAEKLNSLGFEIIDFGYNPSLSPKLNYHADLSFFDCGDGTLFIAPEMESYKCRLEKLGYNVRILTKQLGSTYPDDVPLNCVYTGEYLICNIDTVDGNVLQYFREKNSGIINVRQGYTKCSVLPVNARAVITDDEAIGKKCKESGIDTLTVSKGSVRLDGFDYGFIGGATGRLSDSLIVFNGDVLKHADGLEIVEFIQKYNMNVISLSDNRLQDVGSIIPLYERRNNNEKE